MINNNNEKREEIEKDHASGVMFQIIYCFWNPSKGVIHAVKSSDLTWELQWEDKN